MIESHVSVAFAVAVGVVEVVVVVVVVLASRVFAMDHAVEAKIYEKGNGLLVRTLDVNGFYEHLNKIASEGVVEIEAVAPADDDVNSIYQYLIGSDGGSR